MNENNIITNLSDKEIATLKAVDALGSAPVSKIAKKAGLARTTVYNFIDKLADTGLIAMNEVDGIRLYYNPNESLSLLEATRAGLSDKYHSLKLATTKEAIRRSMSQVFRSHSSEIKMFVDTSVASKVLGKRFFNDFLSKAISTSKQFRVIITSQKSAHTAIDDELNGAYGSFLVARTPLSLDNIVLISDSTLIFISAQSGGLSYTMSDKSMAASFGLLFNNLWPRE